MTDYKNHNAPVRYVDVTNQVLQDSENKAVFVSKRSYFNHTQDDIIIVHRNGLPIKITPINTNIDVSTNFIIRTVYHFKNNDIMVSCSNFIKMIKEENGSDSDSEIELINLVLLRCFNKDGHFANLCNIAIERVIDYNTIKRNRIIYEESSDILLMHNKLDMACPHPFSKEGLSRGIYKSMFANRNCFITTIEIVDNENKIDDRYMYVAKQLVRVPKTEDPSRKSGIYYTRANATNGVSDLSDIKTMECALEEADSVFGLYKSEEAALTGGNPENDSKRKLLDLQQQLETNKLEYQNKILSYKTTLSETEHATQTNNLNIKKQLEELVNENQLQALKHKQEMVNLEHRLEEFKKTSMLKKEEIEVKRTKRDDNYSKKDHKRKEKKSRRDDYFENRSYERKDSSEIIKFIPAALIGAAAVIAYNRS